MATMRQRRGRRTAGLATVATALLVGAVACSGDEPDEPTPAPTVTTDAAGPEPEPEPVSIPAGVTIPETRAGEATGWVLDQLAAADGPSAAEAEERFAEVFLAEVPAEDVATVFGQLRAAGPFAVEGYEGTEDAAQLPVEGGTDRFILHIGTEADGRMNLLFLEAARAVPDLSSLADLDDVLADLGVDASMLVADGVTCEPVHARETDVARPIGSIIKLYVLEAVREAVAAGELTWDDTVTVTDDLRSLPSGVLQDEPAGHEVSVREAAELMISISDNTATDLLIDAVGRDAVLAAVDRFAHHDPELLTPLLTTRELFQLGFTDPQLREQWSTADAAQRESILGGLPGGDIELEPALGQDVVWPQGLDWFATAEDICRAHVGLQGADEEAAAIAEILAINPGLEDTAGWDYVGFKGGSAPGELAGSWYLESGDGERYVVVMQTAATDLGAVPDPGWMAAVVGQTAEILAEEG